MFLISFRPYSADKESRSVPEGRAEEQERKKATSGEVWLGENQKSNKGRYRLLGCTRLKRKPCERGRPGTYCNIVNTGWWKSQTSGLTEVLGGRGWHAGEMLEVFGPGGGLALTEVNRQKGPDKPRVQVPVSPASGVAEKHHPWSGERVGCATLGGRRGSPQTGFLFRVS